MANDDHVAILLEGQKAWNSWRLEKPSVVPDLSNLFLANIANEALEGYDFFRANFTNSDMAGEVFSRSSFRQARFTNNDLTNSFFHHCKLEQATFNNCHVVNTQFDFSNLKYVQFKDCRFGVSTTQSKDGPVVTGTNFNGADLSHAELTNILVIEDQIAGEDLERTKAYRDRLLHAIYDDEKEAIFEEFFSETSRQPLAFMPWLENGKLPAVKFQGAKLTSARISGLRLDVSNHCLDLRRADLHEVEISNSEITCLLLGQTRIDEWSLKDVSCNSVYWDKQAEKENTYSDGEFSRAFSKKPKIQIHYPEGLSTVDLISLPLYLSRLQGMYPDADLHIRSIVDAGAGAAVTITVGVKSGEANLVSRDEITAIKASFEDMRRSTSRDPDLIEAVTKNVMMEVLSLLPSQQQPTTVINYYGKNADFKLIEGNMSNDTYNVSGQSSGVGPGASSENNTFQQIWSKHATNIDLKKLASDLDPTFSK